MADSRRLKRRSSFFNVSHNLDNDANARTKDDTETLENVYSTNLSYLTTLNKRKQQIKSNFEKRRNILQGDNITEIAELLNPNFLNSNFNLTPEETLKLNCQRDIIQQVVLAKQAFSEAEKKVEMIELALEVKKKNINYLRQLKEHNKEAKEVEEEESIDENILKIEEILQSDFFKGPLRMEQIWNLND